MNVQLGFWEKKSDDEFQENDDEKIQENGDEPENDEKGQENDEQVQENVAVRVVAVDGKAQENDLDEVAQVNVAEVMQNADGLVKGNADDVVKENVSEVEYEIVCDRDHVTWIANFYGQTDIFLHVHIHRVDNHDTAQLLNPHHIDHTPSSEAFERELW